MSRSDDERVADIVEAAAEIAAVVDRGKSAWDEDRVSRLAVERLLEIIGESARAMSDDGRSSLPAVPWTGPLSPLPAGAPQLRVPPSITSAVPVIMRAASDAR